MVAINFNWNEIRPINNSLNEGFEELVCQLAKLEKVNGANKFVRKGKPDAGVECLWTLNNGEEIAWQAKFFTNSFSTSQWSQINKSVETAISKHPNMTKLIIAFPVDPSDARLQNQQSMLSKWNEYTDKWTKLAEAYNRTVLYEAWWSSDLITKIQRTPPGFLYFWFNKENFANEWFHYQNKLTLYDLGARYTPELNQELPISEIFDGLSHNNAFIKKFNRISSAISKITKRLLSKLEIVDVVPLFAEYVEDLWKVLSKYNPADINKFPIDIVEGHLCNIKKSAYRLLDQFRNKQHYYWEYSELEHLIRQVYEFERYINSPEVSLANNPFLLLYGNAGCGKSHLLGDAVKRRMEDGALSIFLLGTYFSNGDDPWNQILKHCGVRCTIEQFLYSLNTLAELNHRRIIFFIDAVNEGNGKNLWKHHIASFIERLKGYEWLGVVFSIRSTYMDYMFPKEHITDEILFRHEHKGFEDVTYDAVKLYFKHYGLELINSPLLTPEFNNPLFLSLLCKGLARKGHKTVPLGMQGLSSILNMYMDSVNQSLSDPEKLDCDSGIKIVQKAIEALAVAKVNNKNKPLTVDESAKIISELSKKYDIKHGLWNFLVNEHILSKDLGGDDNEVVEFAYERLQDYYSASYIVNNTPDIKSAFAIGGQWHFIIENATERYYNGGLLEALAILLPEKLGLELYEVVPCFKEYSIAEVFVNSITWRNPNTISVKKICGYINDVVLSYEYLENYLWNRILQVVAVSKHPLNAFWLHSYLFKYTMADRDAWWSIWLKNNYYDNSVIDKIIQWGYDTCCHNPEIIKLVAIVLAWFHTCPNRELRDRSTKSMVRLLNSHIDIALAVLTMFEGVNDPYVLERLYAVIYGSVLQNNYKIEHYSILVEYIHKTIFGKDEVYPHLLLRDYARNIIEYYFYLGNPIGFPIEDIRPPYKSNFVINALTNEELDKRYSPEVIKDTDEYLYGAQFILNSMTTEYGRGCCAYGDFGRYTFEYALSQWIVDCDEMSNIAVEWIFDRYGYNAKKHGLFDNTIGYSKGRKGEADERIGKKYQWIAFHEILARVSDNCKMKEDSWNEDAIIPYQGPWNPFVRDIDPTVLVKTTTDELESELNGWFPKCDAIQNEMALCDWVKEKSDIPDPIKHIEFTDNDGVEWVALINCPEWTENHDDNDYEPYKLIWQQLSSYLVKDDDYDQFLEWAKKQNFAGKSIPYSHSRYEVFEKEFYWSPAYNDLDMHNEKRKIADENKYTVKFDVLLTCTRYLWEAENDHSKTTSLSILKPSKLIYESIKMVGSGKEGIWNDSNGNRVCWDTSIWHGTRDCLLIRKDALITFLKENNCKIIWIAKGEKNVIRNYFNNSKYDPIEIGGFYYMDDNDSVVGRYKTNLISSRYKEKVKMMRKANDKYPLELMFWEEKQQDS